MDENNQAPQNSNYQYSPVVNRQEGKVSPKKASNPNLTKLIIILVLLFVLGAGGYFTFQSFTDTNTQPKESNVIKDTDSAYLPTQLPGDYEQQSKVNKVISEEGSVTYTAIYSDPEGNTITFTQTDNPTSGCTPPRQDVATSVQDYQEFLPSGAEEGCSFSLAGQSKIYKWTDGDVQFSLISTDEELEEDDVKTIAKSLTLQSI